MKFHKKFHVVALLAAIIALNAQAAEVSSVQVRRAVSAWAAANGSAFADPGSVVSAEAVAENGTNLYWVVTMSNGGAVIASPDTDLDLVIAVLEKYDGSFPAGHPLPSILKKDMRNRLSVIRSAASSTSSSSSSSSGTYSASLLSVSAQSSSSSSVSDSDLPDDVKSSVQKANAQWSKYGSVSSGASLLGASLEGGDASPYVRRIVDGFESGGRYTHWNQSERDGKLCYNYHTPNNEVCGCVATAGAALLQFFGCVGVESNLNSLVGCSLYGKAYEATTLGGVYDWSIVSTNFGGSAEIDGLDDASRELFGRVTYDVGVLVGMSWASSGPGGESGAYLSNLTKVFQAYGFNTSRYVSFDIEGSADANQYMKTIYAQNWCGAPVALGIRGDSGGHAVIACGYACDGDGDDFCRVFMGWGGSSDAWYKFPKVGSFSFVTDAVTMIGYQDDAVVPVYGTANTPGVDLTIPGWTDEEGNAKVVSVNDNGSFGIRVPMSLAEESRKIAYAPRNIVYDIAPFDADTIADVSAERADLDAALPNEILFSLLNMKQASTVEAARAIALNEGMALLMVSGNAGADRTRSLLNALYSLDESTDISNRFVFVYTSVKSSSMNGVDGDPSIGVFDPAIGTADLRWWIENGRLAYDNFIDYVDDETDSTVYTLDGKSETEIVAMLSNDDSTGLLDVGYDAFLRNRSDAVVTVTGVDLASGLNDAFEPVAVDPSYGEISKAWTNCESVVFSAPAVYTNETAGVVYRCEGWSTNEVFDADGKATYNAGNTATIDLKAGTEIVFTWVWRKSHYRVKASAVGALPALYAATAVDPSETWCEADARMTVTAVAAFGSYALAGWNVETLDEVNCTGDKNGNTISFFVNEPLNVYAEYAIGASAPSAAKTYTVTIESNPAEISANVALKGSLQWGENIVLDPVAYLAPQTDSYTDSTGGVWVCTGWSCNGNTVSGSEAVCDLTSAGVTCVAEWTLQVPASGTGGDTGTDDSEGGDDDPTVEDPVPLPIGFSSISQGSDGVWTLTITNGVKGCWYHLECKGSLSGSADWAYAALEGDAANPKQAEEDGDVTFRAIGSGESMFWRARATAKETGD